MLRFHGHLRQSSLKWIAFVAIAVTFCSHSEGQTRRRSPERGAYRPPILGQSDHLTSEQHSVRDSELVRPAQYEVMELEPTIEDGSWGSACCNEHQGGCACGGGQSYCDSMGCDGCATCRTPCYPQFGHMYPCHRMFGSLEYLMWWRRGMNMPALVTSSPDDTPVDEAGLLGQDTTNVLYHGEQGDRMTSGGRAQLGWWLDSCHCTSLLLRFWAGGERSTNFFADENTVTQDGVTGFLAVPFDNAGMGNAADALLVVEPNDVVGNVNIRTHSEIYGGDVLLRRHWGTGLGGRADLFWGYQTGRINESVSINIDSTQNEPDPIGTQQVQVFDSFLAHNEFHGLTLGWDGTYREGCWSYRFMGKLGLGSMNREVTIGGTSITTNDGGSVTNDEGLFARDSNIGTSSNDKFSVSPELTFSIGYHIRPGLDLTFGYNYLMFTNVVQASQTIDTTTTDLVTDSITRPARRFTDHDYWIQGIQFGLFRKF